LTLLSRNHLKNHIHG